MQEILVDINGYNQFIQELDRLQEMSKNNSVLGSEVYQAAVGDGWHDNFAFEESMRESRMITKRIEDMLEKKKKLKIIDDKTKENDLINIGDIALVKFNYSKFEEEIEKIKLTGNYILNTTSDINEISLNSPLGKSLYKSKVGSTITYCVDGKEFSVMILSKIDIL